MGFFSTVFQAEVPDLLARLRNIRVELDKTNNSIQNLVAIEKKLSDQEAISVKYEHLMRSAMDSYGISVWVKDLNGRFVFVNKACCDIILKCTEVEALNMRDGDFKQDKLSAICVEDDLKVLSSLTTRRFLENAVYDDGKQLYIDVIKSPVYENDNLVGIIGSATDITANVPDTVKNLRESSGSIEISLDTTMGKEQLMRLLERRKVSRQVVA